MRYPYMANNNCNNVYIMYYNKTTKFNKLLNSFKVKNNNNNNIKEHNVCVDTKIQSNCATPHIHVNVYIYIYLYFIMHRKIMNSNNIYIYFFCKIKQTKKIPQKSLLQDSAWKLCE